MLGNTLWTAGYAAWLYGRSLFRWRTLEDVRAGNELLLARCGEIDAFFNRGVFLPYQEKQMARSSFRAALDGYFDVPPVLRVDHLTLSHVEHARMIGRRHPQASTIRRHLVIFEPPIAKLHRLVQMWQDDIAREQARTGQPSF